MRRYLYTLVILIIAFFSSINVWAFTATSRQAGNWSTAATWKITRTGSITSTILSTTVSGTGTAFNTELATGDVIMDNTGATIGTVLAVVNATSLTLQAPASIAVTNNAYMAQRVPGSNDDVIIASATASVTITATDTINSITINSGAIINGGSVTLNLVGNWSNNGGTFTASTGTINFNGSNQSIGGTASTTFNNITISGSANVSTAIATNIGGNLTVGNGCTFTVNGFALTVSGTSTIGGGTSGNLTITSATGAKIFTGLITIASNGTWTNTTANAPITIKGGITNNGAYNAGTGLHTFDVTQAISGTISIPNITVTGVTLTNNGTLTVSTTLSGTGTLTQGSGATLNISGTSGISVLNASVSSNTVNYNASSGGQSIKATTYNTLTLGNTSGTQAADGNIIATILNNNTNAASILNMGTNTLSVTTVNNTGNIRTQNTSATPISSGLSWGGTITYDATSAVQTIVSGTYSTLTLGNASGTQTAGGSITATTLNNNTNAANILNMATNTLVVTTVNNSGTIRTQNTSATPISSGLSWNGTITYDATSAAQTIVSGTYSTLTLGNTSGTQTAGGNIIVNILNNNTSAANILNMATNTLVVTTVNNSGTIRTQNTSTTPISSGLSWDGTFSYDATTAAQSIVTGTYSTLTLGNISGAQIAEGNITCTTLNNNTNAANILDMGTNTLVVTTVNNTGNIKTQNLSSAPISSGLTWGGTVTFNGTGSQTLPVSTFNNLSIANTSSGINLAGDITVNGTLTLSTGNLLLGSNNLTIGVSASAVAGSPFSASNMVVASGAGELRKNLSGNGSYTFPIGDNTATLEYSPIFIDFTSGSYTSAYVGVRVTDAIHPNNANTDEFITRYWNVNTSGITNPVYTIDGIYLDADIVGVEANISFGKYIGTLPWIKYTVANPSSNLLNATGVTNSSVVFSGISNTLPTISITGGNVAICNGSSVSLGTNISRDTPFTYAWTGQGLSSMSSSSPTATPTTTTTASTVETYTVTLTDGNGFTATASSSITINPVPGVSNQTSTICSGNLFTITPSGVPSGTTYTWSTPTLSSGGAITGASAQLTGQTSISQTLTNTTTAIATATYTVTPATSFCTGNPFNVVVTVNPTPSLNSTLSPTAICSGATFSYTASSATSGATFSWTRTTVAGISQSGTTGTGNVSEALTNTTTAPVTVTYVYTTTANGCSNSSQNVVVTVNPIPILSSTLSPAGICSGTTFSYTATSATAGTTFTWTRATIAGISQSGTSGVANVSEMLTNTTNAAINVTYVYTCTASSCANSGQNIVVTVTPAVSTPTFALGANSFRCPGAGIGNYIVSANNTTGLTYSLDATSIAGGSSINASTGTVTFAAGWGGTSTVTASAAGCSGPRTATHTITETNNGALGPISGPVNVCANVNGPSVSYSVSPVSGVSSYTWTVPSGCGITGNGSNTVQISFPAGFTEGTIIATIPSSCGGADNQSLAVKAIPFVPAAITGVACVTTGTSRTYSIPAVSGATTYVWTVPSGVTILSGQGTPSINASFTPSFVPGNISVSPQNACGSSSVSSQKYVGNSPQMPGDPIGPLVVCSYLGSGVATYSIAPVAGATYYQWSKPNGATITSGQGTTTINVTYSSNFNSGSFSVSALNSCGSSPFKTFAVRKLPSTPTISGSTTVCANVNGAPVSFSVPAVSGISTYNWTVPLGCTITGNGGNSVQISFPSGFTEGTITITIPSNCGASATQTIAVKAIPYNPSPISGPTCISTGSARNYSIPAVAGATSYLWSLPTGANIASGQGTSAISASFTNSFVSGNIVVTPQNSCGNSSVNAQLSVSSPPVMPPAVTGPTVVCSYVGSGVATYSTPTVAGAISYQWSMPSGVSITSGQGTNSVNVSYPSNFISGNLSVCSQNTCGRSSLLYFTVITKPNTPANISGTTNVYGQVGTGALISYSTPVVDGINSYNWTMPTGASISSGQGTNSVNIIFDASYTVGDIGVIAVTPCGNSTKRTLKVSNTAPPAMASTGGNGDSPVINIYPQPAINKLTIDIWQPNNVEYSLAIIAIDGKEVFRQNNLSGLTHQLSIDCSSWGNYLYYALIRDKRGSVLSKKPIIIQP